MTPIIKWAGGKSRLLPELRRLRPLNYGRYFEPFAGGAALFFDLEPVEAVLNDANPALMLMYGAVRDSCEDVIDALSTFKQSKEEYYAVRERFNRKEGSLVWRAAAFLYLNRTCFNGLWRVNGRGHFNVPYRKKLTNFVFESILRSASRCLHTCFLACGTYEIAVKVAKHMDFVYFDPPYDGTFSSYTNGGFTTEDQIRLAATCEMLSSVGVSVMVSNLDTPLIRDLYRNWNCHETTLRHQVGASESTRFLASEVILTNY